ncbi:MAG: hypothetical protein H7A23_09380 [Leptospiraceae bacterium]|nr:hypothetical protein [Leptospiraceae bacterium]MCP5494755.1 hypothetical protein [Leptospiraceae bacterium]
MRNKDFIEKIESFIIKNNLSEAINLLLDFIRDKDKKLYHMTIIQASRLSHLREQEISGTISTETKRIEYNKISQAILRILDYIRELPDYEYSNKKLSSDEFDHMNTLKMKKSSILEKLGYMYQKEIMFADGAKKYEMKQEIKELEQELQAVESKLVT